MVIFHGTEWDTDGETHPNNPIPLIFKHPLDGLKRWCNFPAKPWFLREVEHERGKVSSLQKRSFLPCSLREKLVKVLDSVSEADGGSRVYPYYALLGGFTHPEWFINLIQLYDHT